MWQKLSNILFTLILIAIFGGICFQFGGKVAIRRGYGIGVRKSINYVNTALKAKEIDVKFTPQEVR